MPDFKIGNYSISSQTVYDALKKAKVTDDELKKIDTNHDMKITDEDEYVSAALSDDDDLKEEDDDKEDDDKTSGELTEDELEAMVLYEKQISSLEQQKWNLNSELSKAEGAEQVEEIQNQISELGKQITQIRQNIFNLLYKAETQAEAQAEAEAAAMNSSNLGATDGLNLDSNTALNSAVGASGNSSSKAANYAIQYDGKSASEMNQIMSAAGCRFDAGAWCADFVTFATKMANGGSTPHDFDKTCPNTAYCPAIGSWAQERGLYTNDVSKVKPGDFILYGGRGSEYHIGIVTAVNPDGSVDTVEGNTSDDNGNYTDGVVNQHKGVRSFGGFVLMH